LHKIEIWRFERGGALGHERKFGESATAKVEETGEDGITRLKASHATPHLDHDKSLPSVAGS
jgi:hypothetical protein